MHMRPIDLAGKSVLVTGGTKGIGAAVVDVALAAGATVAFCSRTAADVATSLSSRQAAVDDGRLTGLPADVSSPEDVTRLFAHAASQFGAVDGIVHAAAVLGPIGRVGEIDPTAWWDAARVDLFGTFLVIAEACRHMERKGGKIAVFSGGGATTPFPRFTAYAASKVGVVRLVESVALEYAESGITINAVAPGFVATQMHQATLAAGAAAGADYLERTRRDLENGGVSPEVGARCASFLISDAAKGISGRIVAATWDDWERLDERSDAISGSDLFTLRRIVPRDRGGDWQ
jgi:NAD(P)-dependent dehydrogenase (short-subunit alcohol dehydrogenase family)